MSKVRSSSCGYSSFYMAYLTEPGMADVLLSSNSKSSRSEPSISIPSKCDFPRDPVPLRFPFAFISRLFLTCIDFTADVSFTFLTWNVVRVPSFYQMMSKVRIPGFSSSMMIGQLYPSTI